MNKFSQLFLLLIFVLASCQTDKRAEKAPITDFDTFPPEGALVTASFQDIFEEAGIQYLQVIIDEVNHLGRTAPSPSTNTSYTFRLTENLSGKIDPDTISEGDKLSLTLEFTKRPNTENGNTNDNWVLITIN